MTILSDILWFLKRWKPVSVKWNSHRFLWSMASKRHRVKAAFQSGKFKAPRETAVRMNAGLQ